MSDANQEKKNTQSLENLSVKNEDLKRYKFQILFAAIDVKSAHGAGESRLRALLKSWEVDSLKKTVTWFFGAEDWNF